MPRTLYPTGDDLSSFIQGNGYTINALWDLAGAAAEASAEWEKRTGYTPFLADTVDVPRVFDPPGGGPRSRAGNFIAGQGGGLELEFEAGLVSLTSISLSGSVYTQGTQFFLRPNNATIKGRPYESAEFLVPVWSTLDQIVVVGKWGYTVTLPDNVWAAIRGKAFAIMAPVITAAITGGATHVRIEKTDIDMMAGSVPLPMLLAQNFEEKFDKLVCQYTRSKMGL